MPWPSARHRADQGGEPGRHTWRTRGARAQILQARSLEVDREALAQSIMHGSGRSYAFEVMAGMDFSLDSFTGHVGALLAKDVGIVASLAKEAHISPGILFGAAENALAGM